MTDNSDNIDWELTVKVRNGIPLVPVSIICPVCEDKVERNPGTYTYECSCGAVTILEVPRGDTTGRNS